MTPNQSRDIACNILNWLLTQRFEGRKLIDDMAVVSLENHAAICEAIGGIIRGKTPDFVRQEQVLTPCDAPTEFVPCECCENGRWETECCSGADGCDCRGQRVDMGACNVCGGTGWRHPNADTQANCKAIGGACFIGRGPTSGIWSDRGSRGGFPIIHRGDS